MSYRKVVSVIYDVPYRKESFHVSYSEYSVWRGCPFKYKKEVISEEGEPFNGNIYTLFGTLMHEYIQDMLAKNRPLDGFAKPFKEDFETTCYKNSDIIDNYSQKLIDEFSKDGILILDAIRKRIRNSWKDWTFISAEHKILHNIPKEYCNDIKDPRKNFDAIKNER